MKNRKLFNRPAKHYAIAFGVMLWLVVVIFAMVRNPSATDAGAKMTMMKADMRQMLANGGDVIHRSENAKFGGALLSILIRKEGWTEQLRKIYLKTLEDHGWRQIQAGVTSFCKEGVLVEIHQSIEDYKGVPVVLIGMRYNATTINTCK